MSQSKIIFTKQFLVHLQSNLVQSRLPTQRNDFGCRRLPVFVFFRNVSIFKSDRESLQTAVNETQILRV